MDINKVRKQSLLRTAMLPPETVLFTWETKATVVWVHHGNAFKKCGEYFLTTLMRRYDYLGIKIMENVCREFYNSLPVVFFIITKSSLQY